MAARKKLGAPLKSLDSYLAPAAGKAMSLADYASTPATAFLRSVCDAHDAFEHCKRKFTKKGDGTYNKDSDDSLRHISVALLATTMGHFETYQKCLFAGVFERTRFFESFDPRKVSKALETPSIDVSRFSAYRGATAPVGLTVADSLRAWHSASAVNSYFCALGIRQRASSNDDIAVLELLWQLRHSVVHTAAWLTLPDAQKVLQLHGRGERAIAFDHSFVNALSRRLHKLVKGANARVHEGILPLLGSSPQLHVTTDLSEFLGVNSPKQVWLN